MGSTQALGQTAIEDEYDRAGPSPPSSWLLAPSSSPLELLELLYEDRSHIQQLLPS
jgi:hypothetical protein